MAGSCPHPDPPPVGEGMHQERTVFKQLLTFLTAACLSAPVCAEEIVHATLVAEHSGIMRGEPFQAGVLLDAREGWHTYWENPGDAGIPTTLEWTLPAGFTAGRIDWPAPRVMSEGTLTTYAYTGKTFLPVTITPPAALDTGGAYPIKVKANWLVCKDICIPESAELEISLPVVDGPPAASADASLFEAHKQSAIRPIASPLVTRITGKHLTISADLPVQEIRSAVFIPRDENVFNYAAKQSFSLAGATLNVTLEKRDDQPITTTLSGLLSVTDKQGQSHAFDVLLSPPVKADAPPPETPWLPTVLLLALLGGLVLNLMPCVLPVLSLKALAIVKKGGHSHQAVIRQGLSYTLGVLVSFALVAGILIALRSNGEAIGWGYQMQSPAFVGFLIYLLFMVGLNLSGLFHLPVLLGNAGGDIANESSARGSFFTGVLATAVATPCTAPFMASAVGVALTLPAFESLLVFEALGLGLALPFLLISLFPGLRRFLPRPGAWMETFRQCLAFPMYASVIWLLWVVTLQTGAGGMVVALSGMLAIIVTIWMKSLFARESGAYRLAALALYALILFVSLPMLMHMEADAAAPMAEGMEPVAFSAKKLDELRAANIPVFVDATAAWCITCQLNAKVAIHTPRVMQAFKDKGVTLMIADWTRRNDEITAFLGSFGYKGVPLYVFYPAGGGEPKTLPQLLTEDKVIEAISTQGE